MNGLAVTPNFLSRGLTTATFHSLQKHPSPNDVLPCRVELSYFSINVSFVKVHLSFPLNVLIYINYVDTLIAYRHIMFKLKKFHVENLAHKQSKMCDIGFRWQNTPTPRHRPNRENFFSGSVLFMKFPAILVQVIIACRYVGIWDQLVIYYVRERLFLLRYPSI